MRQKENIFKVLILGDPAVGKSCLLLQYCEKRFQPTHIATIGIDFKMKVLNINDTPVKMQLWDTAGQERFQTLASTLFKGANGVVVVYSVDNRKSFEGVARWLKQIKENAGEEVSVVLVANKSDLETREVTSADGKRLADTNGFPFFEVSALKGENVNEAFESLAHNLHSKMKSTPQQQEITPPSQQLTTASATAPQKKKSQCPCN